MKKVFLLLALFVLWHASHPAAATLLNTSSFQVTIVRGGVEYEWEYSNPDEFEYEFGSRILKGEKAAETVKEMYNLLQVSPEATVKQMMQALREKGYHDIERLDVRWINDKGKLYTWVWTK